MTRPAGKFALEMDVHEARALQEAGACLLDLRDERERATGSPAGAAAAGGSLAEACASRVEQGAMAVLLICSEGVRSLTAARELRATGLANAISVRGGFEAWRQAGLPTRHNQELDPAFVERYARHLVMPEIGPAGQQRLANSAVLLVGAGGLGSPAAQYLAAAGVGRIGLVDPDRVERSNLQRQLIHDDAGVGQLKAASAAARLEALNPDITVEAMAQRLERGNVDEVLPGWDIIIDGCDNFPTRYLLSDACLKHGLPLIYGAVMRFSGQVSVFWPAGQRGENPCYRCLFPEPPGPAEAPDCATAGVLGVLPGIIGTLQAAEALKLVLGVGVPLIGTLLRVDALSMTFRSSRLRADPQCPWCAPNAAFPGYVDYESFCRG